MEKQQNTLSTTIEYCFNEFLKMVDVIQNELQSDRKHIVRSVLATFESMVEKLPQEQLYSKDKFEFPDKPIS